ncbi:MAG: hypothetical protein OXH15_15380 [Gammaproteobacteria bacterium]|nr:hypothetical protein [Gammaproteobacteria bacterium]
MGGIWIKGDSRWETAPGQGFELEKELHDLVEENIQMLPLLGASKLVVVGREVRLGPGWADLIAIELSGRPVIVEVKLARNADAKRGIVAQALSYAAYLQGTSVEQFESGVVQSYLNKLGHETVLAAVKAEDQEQALDDEAFLAALEEHLANGWFRLVLLLDETSSELQRIVTYLDSITSARTIIDVITISRYDVGGTVVALPERVSTDSETDTQNLSIKPPRRTTEGTLTDGPQAFIASVDRVQGAAREALDELIDWATEVAELPGVRIDTYTGVGGRRVTLLPRFATEKAGLVTIWNDNGKPYLSLWRSVFERRAPESISAVEALGVKVGQGNTVSDISTELRDVLGEAYGEATG